MTMREGESVKAYAERYWEMFNEIDDDFDEVAIRTFKVVTKFFLFCSMFIDFSPYSSCTLRSYSPSHTPTTR